MLFRSFCDLSFSEKSDNLQKLVNNNLDLIKQIGRVNTINENKKKPLTDQIISLLLKEKGYNIARRTVAKYREQLDIPVARLRKSI